MARPNLLLCASQPEKKRKKSRSDKDGSAGDGSSGKGKKRAEDGESDVDEVGGEEQGE